MTTSDGVGDHKGIDAALLAFHKNPPHVPLDGKNPHFKSKYATFQGVCAAVRPALAEVGVYFAQPLDALEDDVPAITTVLTHAPSGESRAYTTPLRLGGKTDPQSWGSAITYARRYALLSILGLVGDEDDDANAAMPKPSVTAGESSRGADPPPPPDDGFNPFDGSDAGVQESLAPKPENGISEPQSKMLHRLVKKCEGMKMANEQPFSVDALRAMMDKQYGVTSKAALTKAQASDLISRLKVLAGEDS